MAGNIQQELVRLLDLVRDSEEGVSIDEHSTKELEQYVADAAYREKFASFVSGKIERVESKMGIKLSEDQKITFSLFSAYLRWFQENPEEGQVSLKGGFKFNQGGAMVRNASQAWRESYQDFLQFEKRDPTEDALIQRLLWFESPTFPGRAPVTSYYGCVLPHAEAFPNEFFFYDGGIIYPLPFKTYEEYILALIANAGVECWQYFYVDPKVLVAKNKGRNYMTTQLRIGTSLASDMKIYEYNESYEFDRLDLIHEYLKRVVKGLPGIFPTLDFAHQGIQFSKLEGLL